VSFTAITGIIGVESTEPSQTIILFDEGHGQFFNRSLYNQALSDLSELGLKVVINTGEFNKTSFEGVDVFISTNPSVEYSILERSYLEAFLESGKGMLLLANPLIEENDTLNGNGVFLNVILRFERTGFTSTFWSESGSTKTDVVKNDIENLGKPHHLLLEINNTEDEIFTEYEEVKSIATHTCSLTTFDTDLDLIVGSTETYAENVLGSPHEISSEVAILALAGVTGDINSRAIISGSSIMFSDLNGPLQDNSSWYLTADNSKLWKNIVLWIAETGQEEPPAFFDNSYYPIFILGTGVVTALLIFGGFTFYLIGSGKQVKVTRAGGLPSPETAKKKKKTGEDQVAKETPSKPKLSKRDRRLQQIKKASRKK
jgi:hypothetical protein